MARLNLRSSVSTWGLAMAQGKQHGTIGELWQGPYQTSDGELHISITTLPCRRYTSEVTIDYCHVRETPLPKSAQAMERFLSYFNIEARPANYSWRLKSNIPQSVGMASSTADLLDAISLPSCIQISENFWALRFESMKLASCSTAVEALLDEGVIGRGTTLVDSSSGIYAYALALTCHKYSLRCHIVASTTVDETLLLQLRGLGATVEQVPPSTTLKYDQENRVKRVRKYLTENSDAYWMQQYHDRIHYEGYRKIGSAVEKLVRRECLSNRINLVSPVGSDASSAGLFLGLPQMGLTLI